MHYLYRFSAFTSPNFPLSSAHDVPFFFFNELTNRVFIRAWTVHNYRSSMAEIAGYVLRIMSDYWVDHVFSMAIYYTNLRRRWKPEQTIIFIHKIESGDAIIGYGLIEDLYEQDELSEEERLGSKEWKRAIVFKYVVKLDKPLSVKETFLKKSKFRGRYVHGLALTNEQLGSILSRAESPSQ
jgi:hypothetical protein